jgi:hypothetical protein
MHSRLSCQPLQRAPPEIWGEIAENLLCSRGKVARKGHIVRFSRTCRAFHELATPILYRDLRWFAHSGDATDAHDILVLSDVLQRHPHLYNLVRSMRAFGDGSPSRKSPGIKDMLPVDRFTDLRSLDLRDMRVTPEILQAIVSLPFLRELQLFWCSLAPEAGWPTPDSISTSLREVNLAWPKVSSIPETFFSFFPYLHSLVLSVDSTQTSYILHPLIIHDIPATLTSVTVSLETKDAADMFVFVLQKALRLEIVDLLSSSVDAVVVPSDAVPLLHTYRGPPCLAGSFIKGRGVHTVVFSRLSERSGDLEVHMPILEQSSTTITTLSLHSIKDWSNDLTVLIERCAPGLCILRIYYRSCIVR